MKNKIHELITEAFEKLGFDLEENNEVSELADSLTENILKLNP